MVASMNDPNKAGEGGTYVTTNQEFTLENSVQLVAGANVTLTQDNTGKTLTLACPSGATTPVPVANGGTGATSLTIHGVVLGQTTGAVHVTAAGTAGQPLLSGGASTDGAYGVVGSAGVKPSVDAKFLEAQVVTQAAIADTTTLTSLVTASRAGTVTRISIVAGVTPVGGTNTVSVLKNGTTTMLSTATFDPTTITANYAAQALTLTGTGGNLALAAGDCILVTYVSGTQVTPAQNVTVVVEFAPTDY